MSAQAAAKAREPKDDSMTSRTGNQDQYTVILSARMQIWSEVIIAELLNLLEKRRYDSCK